MAVNGKTPIKIAYKMCGNFFYCNFHIFVLYFLYFFYITRHLWLAWFLMYIIYCLFIQLDKISNPLFSPLQYTHSTLIILMMMLMLIFYLFSSVLMWSSFCWVWKTSSSLFDFRREQQPTHNTISCWCDSIRRIQSLFLIVIGFCSIE